MDQNTMIILACVCILAFGAFAVWAAPRQERRDDNRDE